MTDNRALIDEIDEQRRYYGMLANAAIADGDLRRAERAGAQYDAVVARLTGDAKASPARRFARRLHLGHTAA
jgi:hypothetical protein